MKTKSFFTNMFSNLPAKVLSVLIAFVLFLIYQNNSKVETTISLPIRYIINEDIVPVESLDKIKNVDVTLRSNRVLNEDDKSDFYAVVDLSYITLFDVEDGKYIKNAEIKILNRGDRTDFEVVPSKTAVSLTLERKISKEVPILAQSSGRAPYGYREEITTFPNLVVIEGPKSVLDSVEQIFTIPINLEDAIPRETLTQNSYLTLGPENRFANVDISVDEVIVNVKLMEIVETRSIANVSITVSNNPPNLVPHYLETKGSVSINGSILELEKIASSDFYLVVYADEVNSAGTYSLPLNVVALKKNIKVLNFSPQTIEVEFTEME